MAHEKFRVPPIQPTKLCFRISRVLEQDSAGRHRFDKLTFQPFELIEHLWTNWLRSVEANTLGANAPLCACLRPLGAQQRHCGRS